MMAEPILLLQSLRFGPGHALKIGYCQALPSTSYVLPMSWLFAPRLGVMQGWYACAP